MPPPYRLVSEQGTIISDSTLFWKIIFIVIAGLIIVHLYRKMVKKTMMPRKTQELNIVSENTEEDYYN